MRGHLIAALMSRATAGEEVPAKQEVTEFLRAHYMLLTNEFEVGHVGCPAGRKALRMFEILTRASVLLRRGRDESADPYAAPIIASTLRHPDVDAYAESVATCDCAADTPK